MARFDRLTVYNTMLKEGMIPLFYNGKLDISTQVVAALAGGGSHILEFTNRGDFAIEVFSELVKYCAKNHPDMIIGVGSVEDAATAALFAAHGANFVVGPTFSEETARFCNRRKLAYIPGCGNLNDIATAEEWGAEIVKAFPGTSIGGPDFVKSVLAPRPWSRIMPTGGVTPEEDNLRKWFDAGVACVGMGSNLIKKEWLDAGNFEAMQQLTSTILERIQVIRTR